MIWQDIVLSIGNIIFLIALFPSLLSNDKPAFSTSVMTGLALFAFSFVYFTLDLFYSSIITFITAIAWGVLAIQKHRKKAKESRD